MTDVATPQPPAEQPPAGPAVKPHRGVLILVLGILGFFCCGIPGIVAWVLANKDLSLMAAGQMDKSGEGLTKAGKICGIISIVLAIIGIIINIVTGGAYLKFQIG